MKKVLLARPSSLMVKNMERLVASASFEPIKLDDIGELDELMTSDIAAIVISTALSSNVKEEYREVIKSIIDSYSGIPIFITSFTNVRATKIVVGAKLKHSEISMRLLDMKEANGKERIDFKREMIIITKDEMSDENQFQNTIKTFKKLVNNSKAPTTHI